MQASNNAVSAELPALEIFVVNYAGGEKLIDCVRSLLASDYASFLVHIIENNSSDPAIDTIRREYPDVDIIELDENIGYAGAMHVAHEKCSSDFLVICNNDLVFKPDCLAKLVAARQSTNAAAISARIINPHETELESGLNASLNPLFFLIHGVFEDRSRAVYPSGACFLIRRDELGPCLPPKEFFLYYEDVFVGMALRRRGRQIVQANDAVVHHAHGFSVGSVSSYRLTFLRERNRHTCMFVFFSDWTLFKLTFLGPPVAIARLIAAPRGTKSWAGAFLAWIHGPFSVAYILKIRRTIAGKVKSGEEIAAEYFTSRLVPDDHPTAKRTNRLGRFLLGLLRIRTAD